MPVLRSAAGKKRSEIFPSAPSPNGAWLARRELALRFQPLATTRAQLRRMADQALDESFVVLALDALALPGHVRTASRLFLRRAGHGIRRRTCQKGDSGAQDARRGRSFVCHLSLPVSARQGPRRSE